MIRRRPDLDDCPRAAVRDLLAESSISPRSAGLYCPLVITGEPIDTFHGDKQQKTGSFLKNRQEKATTSKAV